MTDLMLLGPSRSDRPAFRFRTRLDGRFYGFRLVYVSRMQRWTLDLSDVTGASIVTGLALVTGNDLLAPIPGTDKPPGQLFVLDDSGQGRVPTRRGFLGDFRIMYRPEGDVAAAAGTSDEVR